MLVGGTVRKFFGTGIIGLDYPRRRGVHGQQQPFAPAMHAELVLRSGETHSSAATGDDKGHTRLSGDEFTQGVLG
jgi:hypothetical protein